MIRIRSTLPRSLTVRGTTGAGGPPSSRSVHGFVEKNTKRVKPGSLTKLVQMHAQKFLYKENNFD